MEHEAETLYSDLGIQIETDSSLPPNTIQFKTSKSYGKNATIFGVLVSKLTSGQTCMFPTSQVHNVKEWAEANGFNYHAMKMETKQPYTKVWLTEKPKFHTVLSSSSKFEIELLNEQMKSTDFSWTYQPMDVSKYTEYLDKGYAEYLNKFVSPSVPHTSTWASTEDKWQTEVTAPCVCNPYSQWKLQMLIQHLNDAHEWSYDKIADWLDTLDNQPVFYPDTRVCTCEDENTDECEIHPSSHGPSLDEAQQLVAKAWDNTVNATVKAWDEYFSKFLGESGPIKLKEETLLWANAEEKAKVFKTFYGGSPNVNVDTSQAKEILEKFLEYDSKLNFIVTGLVQNYEMENINYEYNYYNE